MSQQWVLQRGSHGRDGWDVAVDDEVEGWEHTGLLVGTVTAHEQRVLDTASWEAVVVPLRGAVVLEVTTPDGSTTGIELAGRASVFAGPTDVAYVPPGSRLAVVADGAAQVAVCLARVAAPASSMRPHHLPASDVPVELRGAGQCSREVRNFGVPGVLDAHRLIACEVVTPAGNWSSYPPHKHDEERPGAETQLEEIYYHEVQVEGGAEHRGADPHGLLQVYGSGKGREIDVLTQVRGGDVVLVPHGWHGPAMAVPGYDLYYLNVMAGPGPERAWLISDDPAHGWIRDTWTDQPVDPRLPLGGTR